MSSAMENPAKSLIFTWCPTWPQRQVHMAVIMEEMYSEFWLSKSFTKQTLERLHKANIK